ncbi:aminobenzoyl-glutamate utilization protein B [Nocardioides sp. YR527]|uniref:amidohydrolase n=1 Tax=Nocardioides sp. YR527 TaxID=1881028 RepID=UPI00088BCAF0|nr:amidohydrolase [Nocardioides sp. YR527]SDJ82582.1 aminobenzoyl-glutamate utilization protein B [Nocardioides sp. YR527]
MTTTEITSIAAITPIVDDLAPRFTRLSDEIWAEPELRWEEHASMAKQISAAEEYGARITRAAGGVPTAFTAEWGSGSPVIGFLGEYDALASLSQEAGATERRPDPDSGSSAGHGCHHNLLGSGSLLAAVATAQHLAAAGLPGTVRYYGCPAEEGAAGKTFMVAGGAFEDVDAAVTNHPTPMASASQWKTLAYAQAYFRFRGLPSHAGANPQHGRSALDAAELMNVGVNFLREHMEDTDRIHYAFIDAGGPSANVVQPSAELYYIVRSPTVAKMRTLYERVVKVGQGAALMTETEIEIEFDGACAEVLPNLVLEQRMQANFEELGGVPFDDADQEYGRVLSAGLPDGAAESMKRMLGLPTDSPVYFDGVLPLAPPAHRQQMTGSTDVGDVSWVTPTVQMGAGTAIVGTPGHSWQMVAQGKTPAAHKGMVHGAKVMAATAIDLLTEPELLAAARAEFEEIIALTPYDKPLPDGLVPPSLRPTYRPA